MNDEAEGSGASMSDSLEALVGRPPDELRELYRDGRPADPAMLGGAPRGRVLALERARLHRFVRPGLELVSRRLMPWQGKSFDLGSDLGKNRVLGFELLGFRRELGPSLIDGAPTLILRYRDAFLKNPWPLSRIVDELREIEEGLAIGPAFLELLGRRAALFWWGLSR